jgi:hypothetical protein
VSILIPLPEIDFTHAIENAEAVISQDQGGPAASVGALDADDEPDPLEGASQTDGSWGHMLHVPVARRTFSHRI